MNAMNTQKQKVLKHLRERGVLTIYNAFRLYDCTRLSERIRELESDGHLINHVPIVRDGKRYMAYSLIEEKQMRKAA